MNQTKMNFSTVAILRLVNQQISGSLFKTSAELVSWLGAVQAQEYAQTKWAVGLRLKHLTDNDIEKDFNEGKILRTHVLRPTWHFVTANEVRWLLQLTAPRVHASNAFMYRQLELDQKVFKKCNTIIIKTLQGNNQLTRDAINEEFQKNKIEAKGHRLSYIMMNAELEGIICSGARQGNQFTYALLDERIKATKSLGKEEALHALTKKYFTSRGPATVKDFSTWSGLTMADCRKGIGMAGPHFEKSALNGIDYYFTDDSSLNKKAEHDVYLLPIYDELIMGYKDRSAFFEFKNSLKPDVLLLYDCMIVLKGQIIGTWKRTITTKTIEIEFQLFNPSNKNQVKALHKAIHQFEDFTR